MSSTIPNASRYADNFAYEPVSSRERIAAIVIAGTLLLANAAIAPFARLHLPVVAAYLPVVETAAFIGLALTAATLHAQFRVGGHAPLAILACAFAGFGTLQVPYLLTFPGVFARGGLLGAGPQTAVWLYVGSRIGFAALVGAFVFCEWRERRSAGSSQNFVARVAAGTFCFVFGLTAFTTLGQRLIPTLVLARGGYAPLYPHIVVPTVLTSLLLALAALLSVVGLRARVHVWLAIMLLSAALEICIAGLLSGGRYSVGWYVARADLAIDATLFLALMHAQLASILSRSAKSGERAHSVYRFISFGHKNLARSNQEMLAFAKRDLGFEWAFLARIEADRLLVESSAGDSEYLNIARRPRELELMKQTLEKNELLIENSEALAYAAMPIIVDDLPYGVIGFGSTQPRGRPLNDADRNFIRLVGVLAGSNIERARQHRRLNELAFFDTLTGLPNRALLLDRLQQAVAAAKRSGKAFSVYFLDVDYFKSINDRFGHAAGDDVLREVSRRLLGLVRESDTVARYGGDEFVVLALDAGERAGDVGLPARLLKAFQAPVVVAAGSLAVALSAGASSFPADGEDADTLLRRADEALYRSKDRRGELRSVLEGTAVTL